MVIKSIEKKSVQWFEYLNEEEDIGMDGQIFIPDIHRILQRMYRYLGQFDNVRNREYLEEDMVLWQDAFEEN